MNVMGFTKEDVVLVFNLFKMSLRDRYLGSSLGVVWAILNPIFLLGVYTFVFGFVFKSKLPGSESTFAYAIWLISGYVPYLSITEAFSLTSNSIVSGASLVKNIVFKSETLVLGTTLVAMVPFAVGLTFVIILLMFDGNFPTWKVIGLLPVLIFHVMLLAGIGFFLAATTVFIRDIVQAIPTVTILIVFFTPIFYPIEMLPTVIRKLTILNPFYYICQPYRDVFLEHRLPDLFGICFLAVVSSIVFYLGLKYFRRLKGYFEMKL